MKWPLFAAGLLGLLSCSEKKEVRPNFLFILTDDHRWDALGCAGNGIISTPNLDRLAADGMRFRNGYVTTPISAASRASILTGMYERKHGYTFTKPPVQAELLQSSYPYQLRKSGYKTGFVGKLGVNLEKGWVDSLFDYAHTDAYPYWKEVDGRRVYLTDLQGDYAMRFLDSCSQDQPFCLSLSFWAPHAVDESKEQYFWPDWCDTLYRDDVIPVPPTATQEIFEQQPEFVRHSFSRTRWYWRFDEPGKYQEMVKGYYRMISAVDAVVGKIREKLKERGLDQNTVIIFMGDNGYFLGERGLADKWLMYDLSIRVPLIMYDPRIPEKERGKVTDVPGLNIDINPTLLDMAGIRIPEDIQGESLMPVVQGKTSVKRDYLLFEHLWDFDSIPQSECVRTDSFKFIRYLKHPGFEELYNLKVDPDEVHNVINDPGMGKKKEELRSMLDSLINLSGF
jgi:arylsulfatase A-like enzyme